MRISELHVYPIKGAAGIALQRTRLDAFGLADDRRWMIVDENGEFQTQREHASLALLRVGLEPDALVIRSARAGEVRVPRELPPGATTPVRVWGDTVDAIDCGDAAAGIISTHLGMPMRLVHMPDGCVRLVDPDYDVLADTSFERIQADGDVTEHSGARVSFADGFPLLLITQDSHDELNARLAEPIPILRFRPNVVVSGATPHAEDGWRRISLGEIECDVVKACARCTTTTVDAATGVRGKEPLQTLDRYRKWRGKVWFGQNVIHRRQGEIAVGDYVTVLEDAERRPPLDSPVVLTASA